MELSRSSQSNREDLYENQNFHMIGANVEIHRVTKCEKPKKEVKIIFEYGIDEIMRGLPYEEE